MAHVEVFIMKKFKLFKRRNDVAQIINDLIKRIELMWPMAEITWKVSAREMNLILLTVKIESIALSHAINIEQVTRVKDPETWIKNTATFVLQRFNVFPEGQHAKV